MKIKTLKTRQCLVFLYNLIMNNFSLDIIKKVNNSANKPGIYLWKNSLKQIIYIGKAKNIKKRLKQYLQGSLNSYKTTKMIHELNDFEVIYTLNERDALHLEEKMIKEHKPKFNIKLVNSQKNPYIKVSLNQKNLITFSFSSKVIKKDPKDTSFYFGPLFYNDEHKNFINVLKSIYTYKDGLLITKQSHRKGIEIFHEIKEIFEFKNNNFNKKLEDLEKTFAEKLDFQSALMYKKAQEFLTKTRQPQVTEIQKIILIDYIYFKQIDHFIFVALKTYNYGIVTNIFIKYYEYSGLFNEFIEGFLNTYYNDKLLPKVIYLNKEIDAFDLILNDQIQKVVRFAKGGINNTILENLKINIKEKYNSFGLSLNSIILQELSLKLGFKDLINNLYIFDNSFQNQKDGVGVVLVFNLKTSTKPKVYKWSLAKKIKKFNTEDDLKYMYLNALQFLKVNQDKISQHDLFIADGAINQINEIKEALQNYNFSNKVIGLVKNHKHKTSKVINDQNNVLDLNIETFNFLTNIQILVDKRAKEYLNKTRNKLLTNSILVNIPGVGKKIEEKLFKTFGNIKNLNNASLDQISKVVNQTLACKIKTYLDENFDD